jgi:hypothetical protein
MGTLFVPLPCLVCTPDPGGVLRLCQAPVAVAG